MLAAGEAACLFCLILIPMIRVLLECSERNRTAGLKGRTGWLLVNEVAYIREDSFTQFHAQQPRTKWGAQARFKTLEDVRGQFRLLPEH